MTDGAGRSMPWEKGKKEEGREVGLKTKQQQRSEEESQFTKGNVRMQDNTI